MFRQVVEQKACKWVLLFALHRFERAAGQTSFAHRYTWAGLALVMRSAAHFGRGPNLVSSC
jgi:hypothetical protein